MSREHRACILISCPDRPGIVATVSGFLFERGANIVQLDQYSTDPREGRYFMRLEFDAPWVNGDRASVEREFEAVARRFDMAWRFAYADRIKRMAIMVSREDHCLLELLWQWRWGDLPVEIPLVISNHELLAATVESFGIPYYTIPVTPETKGEAEQRALELLEEAKVDFVVLARYMQVLTPVFLERYPNRVINIHHSFLPAFIGGRPYEQAYARGVKIIGATAHYATEELDAGPIIEQDVARVDHRDDVDDLKKIGRNIERTVLARAVKWHVEDRILVHGNKTIVFAG